MPRFCQASDLERALGGAAILVQLLDKDRDNIADTTLVQQVIDAGSNEIASYIQPTVAIDSLSAPYPLVLVIKAADASAFYAWRYGGYGQGIPEAVIQAHEAAIRWAQDVGQRRATLGVQPKPNLDPPAEMVDPDPNAIGLSVAGFKRGFR